ncbi:unnamed protein product [Polarella glacialis]|uniref:RRM domain-containing protein n=1 Tax=Polarella glacialis TaxID=89957 RepID=A0A813G3J4_POLGL|nr:unnamed protein product [Polarella glacialis]
MGLHNVSKAGGSSWLDGPGGLVPGSVLGRVSGCLAGCRGAGVLGGVLGCWEGWCARQVAGVPGGDPLGAGVLGGVPGCLAGCWGSAQSAQGAGVQGEAGDGDANAKLSSMSAIVVGAGPSGLLLAHRLLKAGASVSILESRSDPRGEGSLAGRAYALGLGIRGRTAIRTSSALLWEAIKPAGFESEKFKLHFSPSFSVDLRTPEDNKGLEPSLLIYQTDLCAAMLNQLESQYSETGRLRISFGARVVSADPVAGTVRFGSDSGGQDQLLAADVIAGCDGVNSVVRSAIAEACDGFSAEKAPIPGNLKVIRFRSMPVKLDASAVNLVPGSGGATAFVEPTPNGACALITWRDEPVVPAPKDASASSISEVMVKSLGELTDPSEARTQLALRFPLLEDVIDEDAGRQFVEQKPSSAATVRCNTFHYGKSVLLGDAAHSTGGASGQGCNSALQDAVVLADLLENSDGDFAAALQSYSERQVPEGHALLELSIGPGADAGPVKKALYGAATFIGTLLAKFQIGEAPLQTQLTTSLTPIAEIRRKRDFYFGDFPTPAEFKGDMMRAYAQLQLPHTQRYLPTLARIVSKHSRPDGTHRMDVDYDEEVPAEEGAKPSGRRIKGRGTEGDDRYAGKAGQFESLADNDDGTGPARSIEGTTCCSEPVSPSTENCLSWVVIVSGVHEEAQEDDVFESFSEFGEIKNLHLNLDRRTGFVKGYAFIEYESKAEAETAIKGMDGQALLDSKLAVSWAFSKPRGGRRRR